MPETPATPATPQSAPTTQAPQQRKRRTTKLGATWVGVVVAAIVLILLLIFILENSRTVKVSFLGMHGHLSLAVAMLLSAVAGILLVALPGGARILQLRRALRRQSR